MTIAYLTTSMAIYFYACQLITPTNICNYRIRSGFEIQTENIVCLSKKHSTPFHAISRKTRFVFSTFYLSSHLQEHKAITVSSEQPISDRPSVQK